MTEYIYPSIQERYRTTGVSIEAQFVRKNIALSHNSFIGNSVFIKEMYKQQLKKKFDTYSAIWRNETMFSSSITEITNNSAYRSIIGLGTEVIPLIIKDLEINENHWFSALEALTGENPIKKEHRGIVKFMKNDWLDWAYKNNQIDETFFTAVS